MLIDEFKWRREMGTFYERPNRKKAGQPTLWYKKYSLQVSTCVATKVRIIRTNRLFRRYQFCPMSDGWISVVTQRFITLRTILKGTKFILILPECSVTLRSYLVKKYGTYLLLVVVPSNARDFWYDRRLT